MNAKAILGLSLLAALAATQGVAHAQTTTESPKKAVTQTSCKDYIEMDETIKPKFIYFTMGYSKHGKPTVMPLDVVGVDKLKPVLDEYCRVNLTASAYQKMMKESKASEKMNK